MEPNMNFTYRDSKNVEHTISFEEKDFALSQYDTKLSDEKMKSKPTTFFKDALHRFSKNKSSVAGAIILGTIALMAVFVPIIDTNSLDITQPFMAKQAKLQPKLFAPGTGFWDGTTQYKNIPINFDWDAYDADGTYSGAPAQTENSSLNAQAILGDIAYSKVGEKKLDGAPTTYARGGYICFSMPAGQQSDIYLRTPLASFLAGSYDYHFEVTMGDVSDFEDFPYGYQGDYSFAFSYAPMTSPNTYQTIVIEPESAQRPDGNTVYTFSLSDYPDIVSGLSIADAGTVSGYFSIVLKGGSGHQSSAIMKSLQIDARDGSRPVTESEKEKMAKISALDANGTLLRAGDKEQEAYAYRSNGNLAVFHADYVTGTFTYDTYEAAFGNYLKTDFTIDNLRIYGEKGWMTFDYSIADFLASSRKQDEVDRFVAGVHLTEEGEERCPLQITEENPLVGKSVGAGSLRTVSFSGMVSRYREYGYESMPIFLFGTDDLGRDMFKLVFNGLRFSLILGIVTTAINLTIGLIWGALSGYFGGWVDIVMERVCEILGGIPFVVVMTLILINRPDGFPIMLMVGIALCATGWLGTASLTRTQFYRFKDREYILAARTLGAKDTRLIFRHILPNAIGTLITSSVLMIPSVIFSEASLSYLKLVNGLEGFGSTLSENQIFMMNYPFLILFPSVVMALVMISFNLFGNGLRDAFNPSLKGGE